MFLIPFYVFYSYCRSEDFVLDLVYSGSLVQMQFKSFRYRFYFVSTVVYIC
jgi:hypothetical protein